MRARNSFAYIAAFAPPFAAMSKGTFRSAFAGCREDGAADIYTNLVYYPEVDENIRGDYG